MGWHTYHQVALSLVKWGGDRVVLQGQGPVRTVRAGHVSEESEGVFERGYDARGPAGLARSGRAQGEGDGPAEIVAVGQEHLQRVGGAGGRG